MGQLPPRFGKPYRRGEIALIYISERSPENIVKLGRLLGRGETAIDWVMGWCEGRRFPRGAHNRIRRQVKEVREELGRQRQGTVGL